MNQNERTHHQIMMIKTVLQALPGLEASSFCLCLDAPAVPSAGRLQPNVALKAAWQMLLRKSQTQRNIILGSKVGLNFCVLSWYYENSLSTRLYKELHERYA